MEEHPNAELIEEMALALLHGINTIPKLSLKLNVNPDIIKSLLENEFIGGKFAEKRIEMGEDIYSLTQKGESDANFIAIGRGEYKDEPIELNENEIVLIHKQILLILENSTKDTPVDLFERYFELYPEMTPIYPEQKKMMRFFSNKVWQLEDGQYIENNSHSGFYITNRGIILLEKIRTLNLD